MKCFTCVQILGARRFLDRCRPPSSFPSYLGLPVAIAVVRLAELASAGDGDNKAQLAGEGTKETRSNPNSKTPWRFKGQRCRSICRLNRPPLVCTSLTCASLQKCSRL